MNLSFTPDALEEYVYWQKTDKKVLKKVNELFKDILRHPYEGIGKPEPLKFNYAGHWSRRITQEHRLVYRIEGGNIIVVQIAYHYE